MSEIQKEREMKEEIEELRKKVEAMESEMKEIKNEMKRISNENVSLIKENGGMEKCIDMLIRKEEKKDEKIKEETQKRKCLEKEVTEMKRNIKENIMAEIKNKEAKRERERAEKEKIEKEITDLKKSVRILEKKEKEEKEKQKFEEEKNQEKKSEERKGFYRKEIEEIYGKEKMLVIKRNGESEAECRKWIKEIIGLAEWKVLPCADTDYIEWLVFEEREVKEQMIRRFRTSACKKRIFIDEPLSRREREERRKREIGERR